MIETNPANPNFPPTPAQAAGMRLAINLDQVDNTSDANKPISIATQSALNAKADLVGGLIPPSQLPSVAILPHLNSRTQPNTTATFDLYTLGGTFRTSQANAATDYTVSVDVDAPVGAFDMLLINAATEPTVNGSSTGKITGATFAPNTDMYMVIRTLDITNIEYFFLEI